MKTIKLFLLASTLTLLLASCGGGYYVAERPAPYVYTRPAPPYAGAIWIEPEYYWNSGRYVARPELLEQAAAKLQLSPRLLEPRFARPLLGSRQLAASPIV